MPEHVKQWSGHLEPYNKKSHGHRQVAARVQTDPTQKGGSLNGNLNSTPQLHEEIRPDLLEINRLGGLRLDLICERPWPIVSESEDLDLKQLS